MNQIILHEMSKSFGKKNVIKAQNACFSPGQIYGIVGQNGCGKTVLFKCICGFMQPTGGTVLVEGKPVEPSAAQNIGIIIEDPGFIPSLSAFKNLKLLASIRHTITDDEIRAVIARVGLDPESKKHVGKFSLGMRHRLGIAQAIMEKPPLLLLDEPMNGLDKHGVENIRALLLELCRQDGITILMSSHYAEDIEALCDTVCEMDCGVLTPLRGFEE